MIDSKALLTDLKKQLKLLQADLKVRAEDPQDSWGARLREQHRVALERGRTGHPWVTWRDGEVDQAAVAWLVRRLAASGEGLRAGDVVLSGGLTAATPLSPGDVVTVSIDRLGTVEMPVSA